MSDRKSKSKKIRAHLRYSSVKRTVPPTHLGKEGRKERVSFFVAMEFSYSLSSLLHLPFQRSSYGGGDEIALRVIGGRTVVFHLRWTFENKIRRLEFPSTRSSFIDEAFVLMKVTVLHAQFIIKTRLFLVRKHCVQVAKTVSSWETTVIVRYYLPNSFSCSSLLISLPGT